MKAEPLPKKDGADAVSSRVRKVMLVDDHPVMREGLAQLINHEPDLRICGQYEDAASAFAAVSAVRPDLAIVDLTLKRGSGLELVKNIRASYPNLAHPRSFDARRMPLRRARPARRRRRLHRQAGGLGQGAGRHSARLGRGRLPERKNELTPHA